jgi:hypothetical protein
VNPGLDHPVLGDTHPHPEGGPQPDHSVATPDHFVIKPDAPPPCSSVGLPCTLNGNECGSASTCLLASDTAGVCTCPCIADNAATPLVNEDTCPNLAKQICSTVTLQGGGVQSFCLQKCSPRLGANDCQGKLSCDPSTSRTFGMFDVAVCVVTGCAADADCRVSTSTVCSVLSNNCPTGQTCVTFSGADEGRCTLPGKCDLPSGLCGPHTLGKSTAKVGDACKDDRDCAGNMTCLMEFDMAKYQKHAAATCTDDTECCSGLCSSGKCTAGLCPVLYRNGYCVVFGCTFSSTLTFAACAGGSSCNRFFPGGLCQKTCSLSGATDCRGNGLDLFGDYECRAWDNFSLGGTQITSGPVCDFGTGLPCSLFQSGSIDCSDFGDLVATPANPTNMKCRTLANVATATPYDANGFCLDDTSSGSGKRANPLP